MTKPYKKGTRIQKTNSEPGDLHEDGALGTVYEHASFTKTTPPYGYFVTWDDRPEFPVFIRGDRIKPHG